MFAQLKTLAVDRLLADEYFASIPVLDERVQELDNVIDRAVADLGLCVFCTVPNMAVQNPNLPGPYFSEVDLIFRVFERPILNSLADGDGGGKTGLETAATIAGLMHLWIPDSAKEPVVVERIALGNDPDRVAYDVICAHRGGISYELDRVETPEISVAGGNATITCGTAGAAIYYTTDGTQPSPRNGTLYTGAFAASDVTIRTRAWLAGYLASIEATQTT